MMDINTAETCNCWHSWHYTSCWGIIYWFY